MMTDTHAVVEIEASPIRLLGLAGLGLLMTALSALVVFPVFPDVPPDTQMVGYLGVVFFGGCTVLLLYRAVTARGPVITLTREGIRDTRVAAELIPWSAIHNISTWQYRHARVMVLAVDPAIEAGLLLTRVARWTRAANRTLGADGLCVSAQGLKIGFDELLATSMAYAQASRSRGPAAAAQAIAKR
jgi:hypothetical protein